ncbi:hypothetical protein CBL_00214 [Carabus blaptoides fortunei]
MSSEHTVLPSSSSYPLRCPRNFLVCTSYKAGTQAALYCRTSTVQGAGWVPGSGVATPPCAAADAVKKSVRIRPAAISEGSLPPVYGSELATVATLYGKNHKLFAPFSKFVSLLSTVTETSSLAIEYSGAGMLDCGWCGHIEPSLLGGIRRRRSDDRGGDGGDETLMPFVMRDASVLARPEEAATAACVPSPASSQRHAAPSSLFTALRPTLASPWPGRGQRDVHATVNLNYWPTMFSNHTSTDIHATPILTLTVSKSIISKLSLTYVQDTYIIQLAMNRIFAIAFQSSSDVSESAWTSGISWISVLYTARGLYPVKYPIPLAITTHPGVSLCFVHPPSIRHSSGALATTFIPPGIVLVLEGYDRRVPSRSEVKRLGVRPDETPESQGGREVNHCVD